MFRHVATKELANILSNLIYACMHSITLNTGATVKNAAQPVRPDEIKYSSVASVNYKRCAIRKKVWQCVKYTSKIPNISVAMFFLMCSLLQQSTKHHFTVN